MSRANRRRDKSSYAHEVPLKDSNGFHVTHVSIHEARQGVIDGTYKASYASYRMGTPEHEREITGVQLGSSRVTSLRPCVPITRGEADAAVGLHGESRTLHMNEEQKVRRQQKIRAERHTIVPLEDHIERSRIKIAFYPLEHDHRNPATVGPPVDLAALQQFVSL